MSPVREALPPQWKHLIDDYDQDHAMILAEGTNHGLLQSIMMKPPNIAPVFPMRDEDLYAVEMSLNRTKGPVIIVNTEMFNYKTPMKSMDAKNVALLAKQLMYLEEDIGPDFDLVFIGDLRDDGRGLNGEGLQRAMNNMTNVNVFNTYFPFNAKFSEEAMKNIADNNRRVVWVGLCS